MIFNGLLTPCHYTGQATKQAKGFAMDDTRDFVKIILDGNQLYVRLDPYKVVGAGDWTDLTNRPTIANQKVRITKLATAQFAKRKG